MSQTITYREEQSLLAKLLLPQDAEWVKSALAHSAELGRSGSFVDSHLKATTYAVAAIGISFFNTVAYPMRGMKDVCVDIVHLEFSKAAVDFSSDLLKGVQSLFLAAFGVFYIAAGLFFPGTVFQLFEAVRISVQPEAPTGVDEATRQRLDNALREIETLTQERDMRAAEAVQTGARNEASEQRIAELEQQLQQANQDMDYVQQQLLELGAIRTQEVQGLNTSLEFFRHNYFTSMTENEVITTQKTLLEQQLLQKNTEISTLRQQLNQSLLPCSVNHDALQGQIDQLTQQKIQLEQSLAEKDVKINGLQDQLNQSRQSLQTQLGLEINKQQHLVQQLQALNAKTNTLKVDNDNLSKSIAAHSQRENSFNQERDLLVSEKKQLELALEESKTQIKSLREQLAQDFAALQRQLDQEINLKLNLASQKTELERQLNDERSNNLQSSSDPFLKFQLEQAIKEKKELEAKLEGLQKNHTQLKTKHSDLDKAFEDLSIRHLEDLKNWKGVNDDLLHDKQKLEIELSEKNKKIEELADTLQNAIPDDPFDNSQFVEELEQEKAAVKQLKENLSALEKKLEEEKSQSQKLLQGSQTRVQELEQKISELEQSNSAVSSELQRQLQKEKQKVAKLKAISIQKNSGLVQSQVKLHQEDRGKFIKTLNGVEAGYKKQIESTTKKFEKDLEALNQQNRALLGEKSRLETEIKTLRSLDQKQANGLEQSIGAFKDLMEILSEGYKGRVQLSVNVSGEIISFVFDLSQPAQVENMLHQMLRVASLGISNLKKAEDLLASSIFEEVDLHASGGVERPKMENLYDTNHPTKLQKFNITLDNYVKALADEGIDIEKLFEHACSMDQSNQLYVDFGYMIHVLKDAIDYMTPPKYTNARERYVVFVQQLRKVIKQIPPNPQREEVQSIQTVVEALCMARWAGNQIGSYLEGIADMATGLSPREEIPALDGDHLSDVLEKEIQLIDKLPLNALTLQTTLYSEKFYGAVGQKDYTAGENIPNVLQEEEYLDPQGKKFEVVYLRHATPNMPGNVLSQTTGTLMRAVGLGAWAPESREEIATDYEAFLKTSEKKNEAVLFCSHQRMNDSHAIENEGGRVSEIRKLETRHPNVHVFVQSVEGSLFKKNEDIKKFTTLKKKLADSFYNSISPNALPGFISFPEKELEELDKDLLDKLKNEKELDSTTSTPAMEQWAHYLLGRQSCPAKFSKALEQLKRYRHYRFEVLPKLLDDVHGIFFANREEFSEGDKSLEEWQNFILAFYVLQKMDMKFRVQEFSGASKIYYTTPCKDFIDRGGNMAFCEGRLQDYILEQENDPEILRLRRVNLLGPALIARKTAPYMKRVGIGLKFNELLRNLNLIQMNRLKGLFSERKIVSAKGKFPENQPIMPQTVQLAKTPDEVKTVLKSLLSQESKMKSQELPKTIFTASTNMVSEEGHIDFNAIKHQMTRDMIKGIFTVNKTGVSTPDALFSEIKRISLLDDASIQKMMAFVHQGSQVEATQFFMDKFADAAKDIQIFQDTDVNNKYDVTVGLGGATKKIYISPMGFVVKCANAESPFYNQGKTYAKIEAEMEIDFVKNRAVLLWRVSEVNS